jgi:hypothetical protein
MVGKVSRRQFLILSCASALAPGLMASEAPRSVHPEADPGFSETPDLLADPAFPDECPECRGLGMITCPACDGTGMWTEASESAGLYQREAARTSGHCAWCNEWGEMQCALCGGVGVAVEDAGTELGFICRG